MLKKSPYPINKFVFVLQIFLNVIDGKQIDKKVIEKLLVGLIPLVSNLSDGKEIIKRIAPVIDVYDEVNVFMREYTKTGFKFEKFKVILINLIFSFNLLFPRF